MSDAIHARHDGGLVLLGFGSIGRAVLPLLLRHIALDPAKIVVIAPTDQDCHAAVASGVKAILCRITPTNYHGILSSMLTPGDFLMNLAINVSTAALGAFCQQSGALYIDAAVETWSEEDGSGCSPREKPTNGILRNQVHDALLREGALTALVAHGANPGLVSHFVKEGLLTLATDILGYQPVPRGRIGWAELAQTLRIQTIHVTECDTQISRVPRRDGEVVNTWSPYGLVKEAFQPAELGWGSHERRCPDDGFFADGKQSLHLRRPGVRTIVRSWTPIKGPFEGLLFSHEESITISNYYSIEDNSGKFRPTVAFAYSPCSDARASLAALTDEAQCGFARVMLDDIVRGEDEIGVLLMGHTLGAFWYGFRLSVAGARQLAPMNNATTLQTAAGLLGGLVWVLENQRAGLCEPDEIDHRRVLNVARPYLGDLYAVYTNWPPRTEGVPTDTAESDPGCQFAKFVD
jgi:homospermidine synthase